MLARDNLLADIVGFKTPHINHLTPRVLDIEDLYERMKGQGITMIPVIQGPPTMETRVLLQQTSFQAIKGPTLFPVGDNGYEPGEHRARFGEIEQRAIALTPKGRQLYDAAIARVEARVKQKDSNYKAVLEEEFEGFPRGYDVLRKGEFGYFTYLPTDKGLKAKGSIPPGMDLNQLVDEGYVRVVPITYEDFLPVSAAGIFKSNLVDGGTAEVDQANSNERGKLETAIGMKILDPFAMYEAEQARSITGTYEKLGYQLDTTTNEKVRRAIANDPVVGVLGNGRK